MAARARWRSRPPRVRRTSDTLYWRTCGHWRPKERRSSTSPCAATAARPSRTTSTPPTTGAPDAAQPGADDAAAGDRRLAPGVAVQLEPAGGERRRPSNPGRAPDERHAGRHPGRPLRGRQPDPAARHPRGRCRCAAAPGGVTFVDMPGSMPASATSVAVNVTITGQTGWGYASVGPCLGPAADYTRTSLINWQTLGAPSPTPPPWRWPRRASPPWGPVRANGSNGSAHVIVDLIGYYAAAADAGRHRLRPGRAHQGLLPRTSGGKLGDGQQRLVDVSGGGVVPERATAVATT